MKEKGREKLGREVVMLERSFNVNCIVQVVVVTEKVVGKWKRGRKRAE